MNDEAPRRKAGRPFGSKTLDSIQYQEFWVKNKICIPEKELWALNEAQKKYTYYSEQVESGRYSPIEDKSSQFLSIYIANLKEIASRIYPKLKSIDHVHYDPTATMTLEEQLKAVQALEADIKKRIADGTQPGTPA